MAEQLAENIQQNLLHDCMVSTASKSKASFIYIIGSSQIDHLNLQD